MECKNMVESLSLFVLGDLEPDKAAKVTAHLGECPACRDEADRLRGAVELLRADPGLETSPDRRKRLYRAARREGLVRARLSILRVLVPLATAASLLLVFWAFTARPGQSGDGSQPGEKGVVMDGAPKVPVPSKPFADVISVRGDGSLVREDGKDVGTPKPKDALFAGDRIGVWGKEAELKIRFREDALVLTLDGNRSGGTEIRIEGRDEKAYRIHLFSGKIHGFFSAGPLESQTPRRGRSGPLPLWITSPVAGAKLTAGREFEASQNTVNLWKNYFQANKHPGADDTFLMRFDAFDLGRFFTQHLSKIMVVDVRGASGALRDKTLTLVCSDLDRATFRALFDELLDLKGLQIAERDGGLRLLPREGAAPSPALSVPNPVYGEFRIQMIDGKAELSAAGATLSPPVTIFGGQSGRVRPGLSLEPALSRPPREVKSLGEGNVRLIGAFLSEAGRRAVVEYGKEDARATRILRLGDSIAGAKLVWVGWDSAWFVRDGIEYGLHLR